MNFTEVVNEVISITKRPDKLTDTQRAVNSVISQACLSNDFARDLYEDTVAISSSDYVQSALLSDLTRFRKFEYIRPNGQKCPMTKLDGPLAIYDDDGKEKANVYYVAGSNVVLRLATLTASLHAGYFQHPPVLTNLAPTFWLLDVVPYMVIEGAAARLFRNIGDEASARQHEADYRLQLDSARIDLRYGVAF